ncbi:MAG TPA: cupredoxin domain-containing protein [Oligoflexus sp.]|uniref:cupredoxin domain-containing protein n=1 Tax=Oligoflexus sp. TaxID=1971216 RepID=UPI002D66C4FD|nr:cupredoxin domain-containing protein [Oligoflexus sp.]HYX36577.1 cupredoxin domain-containing protein [Oligoflexus sp.]
MRLLMMCLGLLWMPLAAAETVSRTVEARQEGSLVRWFPQTLELVSGARNSLRILNMTNRPQCFQVQNLGEPMTLGPGESRIIDFPAFQHGRFLMGCPGTEAQGGEVVFQ